MSIHVLRSQVTMVDRHLNVFRGLLTCLFALILLSLADCIDDRELRRSDAKKWKRIAEVSRLSAKSAARQFLEHASSDLVVPIEVEVILVGFNGDGGYGYKLQGPRLASLLSTHLQWACPFSWETEEELGVCMHVNFEVIGNDDNPMVGTLLQRLEGHLKANMKRSHVAYDETQASRQRKFYTLEASELEPIFDEFMEQLYSEGNESSGTDSQQPHASGVGGVTGTGNVIIDGTVSSNGPKGRANIWHRHNTVFVLNPSKVRIHPDAPANASTHQPPDLIGLWQQGNYDASKLADEEAGFVYRYTYNGVGESAIWLSSKNYVVVDLSAGPSSYGPLVSQSGATTPQGLPSLKDTYEQLMKQLQDLPNQMTVREYGRNMAQAGAITLMTGRLAAVLAEGVKAAFIPDVASQHLEQAKTLLVPIVVLADHPISVEAQASQRQDDYWGINVTQIEAALAHLLGEGQEAVVITTQHELHRHKQLAAALHKATRCRCEAVVDVPQGWDYSGTDMGLHVNSHTFIDPEALLEEVEKSADFLTHGLVTVAHTMGKDEEHHIAQLRHEGTRVIPVFVLALQNHPDNVMLSNRELVAADHDAVVVLQLRQGIRWGAANEVFTGHVINGQRLSVDGARSTRHVIAGLAQALAGVVPPYQHFEPGLGRIENDWRWATGATPFGPYSNFSGVSEIMQNAARRNELVAHVSAAMRQLQHQLDAVDAFVAHHFSGPWEAAGIKDANRHWLDTVAGTRHGYNSTLNPKVVEMLETGLGNITEMLEQLAMDMYTHDFKQADTIVGGRLLPAVAQLCTQLDHQLDAAEEVMQCCRMGHASIVSQTFLLIMACAGAAAVFFTLIGVALCARAAKRRAKQAVGLPTFGLPLYSGKLGTWSL